MTSAVLVSEYNQLSKVLRNWPDYEIDIQFKTPHIARLYNCLLDLREEEPTTKKGNLAVLIRQVLRAGKTKGELDATLLLPKITDHLNWPKEHEWKKFGIQAVPVGDTEIQLTATPWCPDWLEGGKFAVDAQVHTVPHFERLRKQNLLRPDPFLRVIFQGENPPSNYFSQAQKDAIRNVLASKPGSTSIVNLPTGAGKSLVALAPVYLQKNIKQVVSICVVPTIALAIDQETRVREITGDTERNFAYSSDTPENVRNEIRQNIRNGQQEIVFVSPEMATSALVHSLFVAAKEGFLGYFIFDEAHLFDSWGTEFRPEFQTMVGLRNELLEVQKEENKAQFKTILMSATLTKSSFNTLVNLFGEPGPVIPSISNRLRPEPSYWSSESPTLEIRNDRVIEALRHLPRPAIVFCTQPSKAESLKKTIEESDFSNVGIFTGLTPTSERKQIINQIRNKEIDIVVATSAFGLGVDIDDIRTVIHACVPDTIDRYYQEVGRGGRDGKPAISVVCWTSDPTEKEVTVAKRNASPTQLLWDILDKRWRNLLDKASVISEGWAKNGYIFSVPVAAVPDYLEDPSASNEYWNKNAITLLMRSEALRLRWKRPFTDQSEDADLPDTSKGSSGIEELCFQVLKNVDHDLWHKVISPIRDKTKQENEKSHKMMISLLKGKKSTCDSFVEAYDLKEADHSPVLPSPIHACGGCLNHREKVDSLVPRLSRIRSLRPTSTFIEKGAVIESLQMTSDRQIIIYDKLDENLDKKFAQIIRHFISGGVNIVSASTELLNSTAVKPLLSQMHFLAESGVVMVNELDHSVAISNLENPPLPHLLILTEEQQMQGLTETVLNCDDLDVVRIFVMPKSYRGKNWHHAATLETEFSSIVKTLDFVLR